MKKDIPLLKVEDLAVAMVPRLVYEEDHEDFWDTYIINLKEEPLKSVLVNSTGYGEVNGEAKKTTTLRYFYEELGPLEVIKVEAVIKNVLSIANEYWISFSYNGYLYDKKYVFVPGSLEEMNFTTIPFLNRKGVMIR
jgi:hypothetical protein